MQMKYITRDYALMLMRLIFYGTAIAANLLRPGLAESSKSDLALPEKSGEPDFPVSHSAILASLVDKGVYDAPSDSKDGMVGRFTPEVTGITFGSTQELHEFMESAQAYLRQHFKAINQFSFSDTEAMPVLGGGVWQELDRLRVGAMQEMHAEHQKLGEQFSQAVIDGRSYHQSTKNLMNDVQHSLMLLVMLRAFENAILQSHQQNMGLGCGEAVFMQMRWLIRAVAEEQSLHMAAWQVVVKPEKIPGGTEVRDHGTLIVSKDPLPSNEEIYEHMQNCKNGNASKKAQRVLENIICSDALSGTVTNMLEVAKKPEKYPQIFGLKLEPGSAHQRYRSVNPKDFSPI